MAHHKLIKDLIAEIKRLRQENKELNESVYYYEEAQERLSKKNRQLRDESDRIERQMEQERRDHQYKEWERQDLVDKLEQAERWGNTWKADSIKRELKNL